MCTVKQLPRGGVERNAQYYFDTIKFLSYIVRKKYTKQNNYYKATVAQLLKKISALYGASKLAAGHFPDSGRSSSLLHTIS